MKKRQIDSAIQKLTKTFLGRIGVKGELLPDLFYGEPDAYNLILYVDPRKYNWAGGPDYSMKYNRFMDEPEEYLNQFLKYLNLDSDIINDIKYRRTENSQSFYDDISEKIVEVWPKVIEEFNNKHKIELPPIHNVTIEPMPNQPYDDVLIDLGSAEMNFLDNERFWNAFFPIIAKYDLPLDTFYVRFG